MRKYANPHGASLLTMTSPRCRSMLVKFAAVTAGICCRWTPTKT
nr:MAG TPA: hypothetical protein [Caudoviricetes sp.]